MSKPRKQYNPRKAPEAAHRLTLSAGQSPACSVLGRASSMTTDNLSGLLLPAEQVQTLSIAMLAALDQYQTHGDGTAFRALCHWYRVASYISQVTHNMGLKHACELARLALLYIDRENEDHALPTKLQYQQLRSLIVGFITLLPCLPSITLALGQEASLGNYIDGIEAQYRATPSLIRRHAIDAIKGTPLSQLGGNDTRTREKLLEVAMIGHGLLNDSTLPIPETITEARRMRHRILPKLTALEARIALDEEKRSAA